MSDVCQLEARAEAAEALLGRVLSASLGQWTHSPCAVASGVSRAEWVGLEPEEVAVYERDGVSALVAAVTKEEKRGTAEAGRR